MSERQAARPYVHRAGARLAPGQVYAAIEDAPVALARGPSAHDAYGLRALARQRAEDLDGAQAEAYEGIITEWKEVGLPTEP